MDDTKTKAEPVQLKTKEDPVQSKAKEEPVQSKTKEEPVQSKTKEEPVQSKTKEEPVQLIHDFNCSSCELEEKAHYKGTHPPFSRNIVLKYPSYVMKDPFSPPGKGEILVLGSDCTVCDKTVCISKECSIFYVKVFCLDCAYKCIETFPVEIKNKLVQIKNKKL